VKKHLLFLHGETRLGQRVIEQASRPLRATDFRKETFFLMITSFVSFCSSCILFILDQFARASASLARMAVSVGSWSDPRRFCCFHTLISSRAGKNRSHVECIVPN